MFEFVFDLLVDAVGARTRLREDFRRERVTNLELLEQFLALVLEVSREFGVYLHRSLPFGGPGVRLRVV